MFRSIMRIAGIGLRVLCLVEFTARKSLQTKQETLDGIYQGNPKRTTTKPTTEMMLKAFRGISLNVIDWAGVTHYCLTPLTSTQERILALLGFPKDIYQSLTRQFGELVVEMSEP